MRGGCVVSAALITPSVLSWARGRRGLAASELARKLSVKPEKIAAWESGESRPTFRQAQRLAQALYVPFGYLYLAEPPVEKLPIPDLRTVGDKPPRAPSPDFLDLVNDVLTKQQWYREYQEANGGEPLPFVGRYTADDAPETIAADIRDALSIDGDMRKGAATWGDFLRELILRSEDLGILVMRSGVVGNNNNRPLDVNEFRGFAISDDIAPLVFVNGRDAPAAQVFTLAHEMAHLWIGEGGVSNPDYALRSDEQASAVERLSNRVAAETLVPSADFRARWRNGSMSVELNMERLSRHYKVSNMVALRRACDLGLVAPKDYWTLYEWTLTEEMILASEYASYKGQGVGNFHFTVLARNGRAFSKAVVTSAADGDIPLGEAAGMLNVKIKALSAISEILFGDRLSVA